MIAAAIAALALLAPAAPIVGGDPIYFNGKRCTVAFNARTSSGEHRLLVSGFCTGSGRPIDVIAAPRGSTSTPLVRGPGGSTVTVRGTASAPVGASVCMAGPVSGWRCGTVQAKNVTVNFPSGPIYGLTRASMCATSGDVGAPVVSSGGQAQGVVVGGSGNCATGGSTYYMPVTPTLSAYGLALHTG